MTKACNPSGTAMTRRLYKRQSRLAGGGGRHSWLALLFVASCAATTNANAVHRGTTDATTTTTSESAPNSLLRPIDETDDDGSLLHAGKRKRSSVVKYDNVDLTIDETDPVRSSASSQSLRRHDTHQPPPMAHRTVPKQPPPAQFSRNLDPGHSNKRGGSYKFLDTNETLPYSTLGDVWLCLACALGWTVWLLSSRQTQTPSTLVFEERDSRKVMGNVLQVSLGEDNLGTGIPVYHAIVDFVVENDDIDGEPVQVRKCFSTKKLLEEGFANVQVVVLYDDPTMAILMEDFLAQKKEQATQGPPSVALMVLTYAIAAILVSASVFGAILVILRLPPESKVYGWVSLGVGGVLLYPAAYFLYSIFCYVYTLAGPLSERPGVIINGKRLSCTNRCHANLDPRDVFELNEKSSGRGEGGEHSQALEMSALQVPSIDDDNSLTGDRIDPKSVSTPKTLLYPNAGCGFGDYRIHMPRMRSNASGWPRADSSLSSMSASGHSNRETPRTANLPVLENWGFSVQSSTALTPRVDCPDL